MVGVHDGAIQPHRARRTRKGPIARRSIGELPKHSSASRGLSTMGRPAVLKLVFTIDRNARAFIEPGDGVVQRSHGALDGLDARRAVHVGDRGNAVAPWLGNVVYEQHVRAGNRSAGEDVACAVGEHHGRYRPELLAALDGVESLQVLDLPRVGQ